MAEAATNRELTWPTRQLFVRFLAELYQKSPDENGEALSILVRLAQTTSPIAQVAYHALPRVDRPDVNSLHERRFRERTQYQRLEALMTLLETRGQACVELLLEVLDDPFEPIQRVALSHLARWCPEAVEARAYELLTARDGTFGRETVHVFANLPLERSLVPLFVQSFDRNRGVRETAQGVLQSLGSTGDRLLSACSYLPWDSQRLHQIIPAFIAQTPAAELPRLNELINVARHNARRSTRRVFAHVLHQQLMTQRAKLVALLLRRAAN